MDIPDFAWMPALPAAAIPFYTQSPLGQPELRFSQPVGGYALLDLYACWALSGLLTMEAQSYPRLDEHCESIATSAWLIAAAMARTRPPTPKPPDPESNARPRLVKP